MILDECGFSLKPDFHSRFLAGVRSGLQIMSAVSAPDSVLRHR